MTEIRIVLRDSVSRKLYTVVDGRHPVLPEGFEAHQAALEDVMDEHSIDDGKVIVTIANNELSLRREVAAANSAHS